MKILFNHNLALCYKSRLFFITTFGITLIDLSMYKRFLFFLLHSFWFFISYKMNILSSNMNYIIKIAINFTKKIKAVINQILLDKRLKLSGLGYKSWVVQKNKIYFLILKLGFSFDVCILALSTIQVTCLKYNLILVKSLNREQLHLFSLQIKRIAKIDQYKNKGIFYDNISYY